MQNPQGTEEENNCLVLASLDYCFLHIVTNLNLELALYLDDHGAENM